MPRRRDGSFPPTLKRLGQHFLVDRAALSGIADSLQLHGTETVVEIGPGRGALTDHLVHLAGRVVAVELDRALAQLLRERYAASGRVEVVEADVLKVDLGALAGGPYVLVGNVPYYITTPILFQALRAPRAERAVYLVQREVAERVVAEAGTGEYGALSVNVQATARAEILFRVPAGAFRPPPKVASAVIRITPRAEPLVRDDESDGFRGFVIAAFGLRRKQLRRVLRTLARVDAAGADAILARAALDGDVRPEVLSASEFVTLFRALPGGAWRSAWGDDAE